MRINRTNRLALGVVILALALPAGLAAETPDSSNAEQSYSALEEQIQKLEAQVKALEAQAAAQKAPAAAAAVETKSAPDPLAGIKGVLGGVNMTGLADVYYGYNANNPASGITADQPFERHNDAFGLNLIELQLDKPVDKTSPLGFRVALGFGDAITAVNGQAGFGGDGDTSSTQYLKEGYLSYLAPIGKGLQFDVGKWVTPAGVEVIETNANWNYTRGILFYNAIPYYHFGVRAKYSFNDKWSVAGYAANGWNNVTSTNSGKTGGFTLNWNPTKKLSLYENYLTGPMTTGNPDWNNLSDTVITYNPTGKLSLAAEYDFDNYRISGTETNYDAVAGFAKYQLNPKWAVAGRYEYFNNHGGLIASLPPHIQTFTGTVERTLAGHLIARLEYRHDQANVPYFDDHQHPASVLGQDTVKLGMIFVLAPAQ